MMRFVLMNVFNFGYIFFQLEGFIVYISGGGRKRGYNVMRVKKKSELFTFRIYFHKKLNIYHYIHFPDFILRQIYILTCVR